MDANAMDAVYNQAILFFTLFGAMFIVAFFITKRNAKKFENENPLESRRVALRKERLVSTFLNVSTIKILGKEATLQELTHKLNRGAINTEEYVILKEALKAS